MKKIIDKKNLINLKNKFKKKKFILCHGVFDVIHYGHITHFNNAKKFGDILIVSVTKDIYIKKGINGTIFNELQRVKFLSEISVIDYVYLCETESAADSIKTIKPDFSSSAGRRRRRLKPACRKPCTGTCRMTGGGVRSGSATAAIERVRSK